MLGVMIRLSLGVHLSLISLTSRWWWGSGHGCWQRERYLWCRCTVLFEKTCFCPIFDRKIAVFFQDLISWMKHLSWTSIMEMKMSLLQITWLPLDRDWALSQKWSTSHVGYRFRVSVSVCTRERGVAETAGLFPWKARRWKAVAWQNWEKTNGEDGRTLDFPSSFVFIL